MKNEWLWMLFIGLISASWIVAKSEDRKIERTNGIMKCISQLQEAAPKVVVEVDENADPSIVD